MIKIFTSGVLLVNKPEGMTSTQVGRVLKKQGVDKIGHLGTLDPFASGVLPMMLNGGTRLAEYIEDEVKGYEFDLSLGKMTDTLDPTGKSVEQASVPLDFVDKIREVLPLFRGEIEQLPPLYSALKMKGKPLYEYMRENKEIPQEIESKRRKVFISSLEEVFFDKKNLIFRLKTICSKGTYIRSLARDIAQKIGTVGYCSYLKRISVGSWDLASCVSWEDVENGNWQNDLLTYDKILPSLPLLSFDSSFFEDLMSGRDLEVLSSIEPCELCFVRCGDLVFLGNVFVKNHKNWVHPFKKIQAPVVS